MRSIKKKKKQIFANAVKKSQSIKKLVKVTHKQNILSFYCEKNAGYMCGLYLIMIIFLNSEMQPKKTPLEKNADSAKYVCLFLKKTYLTSLSHQTINTNCVKKNHCKSMQSLKHQNWSFLCTKILSNSHI